MTRGGHSMAGKQSGSLSGALSRWRLPAAQALDRARITTNYNTVPFDSRKPFDPSGIRLGTPAVTTRAMSEPEMQLVAAWIDRVIEAAKREDETTIARIAEEVSELAEAFPIPGSPV